MKAISIWQPFATLIVRGYKIFETRTWAAPRSLIGQRIGIASTKTIRPEQRAHFNDEEFQRNYQRLGLPDRLEDLSHGYMLGTAIVESVELMTENFLEEVSGEEKTYGWWQEGFYAWRMVSPEEFPRPIPVRGAQGIYDWRSTGEIHAKEREASDPQWAPDLWRGV
jgi:activating signal cointegrator 1